MSSIPVGVMQPRGSLIELIAGLTLVLALAGGCDVIGMGSDEGDPQRLVGPTWQLIGFVAADGTTTGPGTEPIQLYFTHEGRIDGRSEVNRFSGRYTIKARQVLSIDSLRTTLVGLPDGSRYLDFYGALRAARAYWIDEQLHVRYSDDGSALLFEETDPQP